MRVSETIAQSDAAAGLAERLDRRILEATACRPARPRPDSGDAPVPSRTPPVERLADTSVGRVFLIDPATGRGQLIQRRSDTRYALLEDVR